MQGSHLAATLSASAMSSLVFASSTPSAVADRPRSLKLFMTSGVPVRRVDNLAEMDWVRSRYVWVGSVMVLGWWGAQGPVSTAELTMASNSAWLMYCGT